MKNAISILNALVLVVALVPTASFAMNISFESQNEQRLWRISNDTVMGGVSRSSVDVNDGALRFSGQLSLENNGGFASVWRGVSDARREDNSVVRIRARGDGREYHLRFRLNGARGISYTTKFTPGEQWQWYTFEENDFYPVWRGRNVIGAPAMRFAAINSVGILLADKQQGQFAIEVSNIEQSSGNQLDESTELQRAE